MGRHTNLLQSQVERNLARSRGEQVFATQDMGHPHQSVIYGVHKRVERFTARSHNHEVRCRASGKGHLASHEVIETKVLVGNPQAQRRLTPFIPIRLLLGGSELALVIVIPLFGVSPEGFVPSRHFFGSYVALVKMSGFHQPGNQILINLASLRLSVGLVRPASLHTFIPVEAQPLESFHELLVALFTVSLSVGIFDAEDKGSPGVLGIGPIE